VSSGAIAVLIVGGIVVGALSALLGVGGGVIMVPLIAFVFDESQHLAEGTSLLVIVPTAIVGVVAHVRRGYVSFRHAGCVALGGIVGAYVGATLALSLDADTLTKVFAVFLLAMGARTIYEGARPVPK
jgi:uncharacterized protein